ncbi:hypothetical protein DHEL01_v204771 [Diaporthe helianthi]|uniref:Uncharacterized protein n=1 Tax=Diaporthe helianthi TaxID=158607 RepID=A0A2P5I2X5_DIAHE|nr:hypothetical protein DHEL01_v204771 [Diaporthe helianthi]
MPLKKLRNSWRATRQTRSRTKRQKEAILESAMPTQTSDEQQGESMLFVFLNDFTDSDNEATAELWAWLLERDPTVKGIYIAEPRWVNLGYYMSAKDFGRCIGLVSKLQPPLEGGEPPLSTVLAGRLTTEIIDSRKVDGRPLNDDERDLLMRCVKPSNGSREDSIQHARLVAMDYLTTMRTKCSRFEAFIDVDCLDKLESPINLKTHYHDELVARSLEELDEFQTIKDIPTSEQPQIEERRTRLRAWYTKAIKRKVEEFGGQSPFRDLDYDHLFGEIRNHNQTTVFGGASLTVLQELLLKEPSLAKKVRYFQQGGTFNSKLNILGNPYNFALNTKAAEFVFENQDKLGQFTLIPTDTTKRVEWTVQGLAKISPAVGVRSLAFHGRYDPWQMVSSKERDGKPHSTQEFLAWRAEWADDPQYTDPKSKGYKAVMADLTAFLAAFTDVFKEYDHGTLKQTSVKVAMEQTIPGSNQMVLREDPASKIECLMFESGQGTQETVLVKDAVALLQKALNTAAPSV